MLCEVCRISVKALKCCGTPLISIMQYHLNVGCSSDIRLPLSLNISDFWLRRRNNGLSLLVGAEEGSGLVEHMRVTGVSKMMGCKYSTVDFYRKLALSQGL